MGQCIIAVAIVAGLLLTTMPITFIGEAFRRAWDKKEILEMAMGIQDMLSKRGKGLDDLEIVFKELDEDGSGEERTCDSNRHPSRCARLG